MAQNVIINGVTYQSVPEVNIPLSGGGTAEFFDISATTLTSGGQMLDGVISYDADGNEITGSIASKSSSDLTASGATVTVPAGYYSASATKSVSSGSAKTPATTITANPTISVSGAGLITATASASQNVTPTVSAGYVSTGTAGTVTVSGESTEQLTTKAATTYNPSTSNQSIASGTYLTGAQTISAVTVSGLSASVIAQGTTVKSGCSADDDCITSVTGTLSSVVVSQDSTTKVLTIS